MIVLGGLGSVSGALYGSFMLTLLQNSLTRLPVLSEFKNLYIVVLGVILILTVSFFPRGIAGALQDLRRRSLKRTQPLAPSTDPTSGAINDRHSSTEATRTIKNQ
jgi:branched-chain amino acid transport system permease protein